VGRKCCCWGLGTRGICIIRVEWNERETGKWVVNYLHFWKGVPFSKREGVAKGHEGTTRPCRGGGRGPLLKEWWRVGENAKTEQNNVLQWVEIKLGG